MTQRYVVPLPRSASARLLRWRPTANRNARPDALRATGNKAQGLMTLLRLGLPVPLTYVCTWEAFEQHQRSDHRLKETLLAELSAVVRPGQHYAVRSSANSEDTPLHSFAGQFKSLLNIAGVDGVWQAIQEVWASASGAAVTAYLARQAPATADLRMAVLIQEMVPQVISGVAFSRNPLTGLDEIVVEAVPGSGEALVQEGITPERWVYKWGQWVGQPEQPALPAAVMEEVVSQTRHIARACRQPVDLEWVYDGATIFWVQLRAITAQHSLPIYSDKIAREVLPGQIKPLVWSVNVPLVNSAWVRLFTELIGPNDIEPNSLARAFHYRAYFNMGVIGQVFETLGMPRDSLELLMGIDVGGDEKPTFRPSAKTFRHTPRMLRFARDKWHFARQVEAFLPSAQARYQALQRRDLDQASEPELLAAIDQLYTLTGETAYFNIVTPLLMGLYNRLFASQLAKSGIDAAQVDVTQGLETLRELDPAVHMHMLLQRFRALTDQEVASLATLAAGSGKLDRSGRQENYLPGASQAAEPHDAASPALREFQHELADFLRRFGHLSDSGNDFSSVPWRENPELLLQMMANSTRSRQDDTVAASATPSQATAARRLSFAQLSLPAWRRPLLEPLYRRARSFRLYREQISSLYTFGYGLFRDCFLALGRRFADRTVIASPEDIFYLYLDEVRSIVSGDAGSHRSQVEHRRREMDASRNVVLPGIIYGDQAPPVTSFDARTLAGTPTSRGYHQGPARVIRGLYEFDKLQPGDVLVIPFSDVGWTPLFARAGAVIAESGGMLSHSSIVAREYGIPAVVSVPGACHLQDGTLVAVDGYSGKVAVQIE